MRLSSTPWAMSQSAMQSASEISSPGPCPPEQMMGMSGLSAMKSSAALQSRREHQRRRRTVHARAQNDHALRVLRARIGMRVANDKGLKIDKGRQGRRHTSTSRTRCPHFAHACSEYCASSAKTIKSAVRHQNRSPAKRTPGTARHVAPSTAQTAAAVHSLFCFFMVRSSFARLLGERLPLFHQRAERLLGRFLFFVNFAVALIVASGLFKPLLDLRNGRLPAPKFPFRRW